MGVSGIVKDAASIEYLKSNNKIGDILPLKIVEDYKIDDEAFSKKALILLSLPENVLNTKFRDNLFSCLGENSQKGGY